jgi:hypothetical protein
MYLILMCAMAVFSGWALWHRNPLFSMRTTLRFMVVLAAMIGTFVLAELATIDYVQHFSQTVQLVAIFAVVGAGTLAMIGIAITLSLPKASPLPASAKQLRVFRTRTLRWVKGFGWALVAFALLELVLRGAAQIMVGTIGGLFAFMGVVMLFGGYLTARRTDLWLSAVEASPWVHWTYTPAQWRQWTDVEVQRTTLAVDKSFRWRRDWKKATPLVVPALAVPLFFVDEPWRVRLLLVAVIGALLVTCFALVTGADKRAPQSLRKKLAKADPEVFFGEDGLFADGDFTPWQSAGVYLQAACIDEREPRGVSLRFLKIVAGAGAMQELHVEVNLPLPVKDGVVADLARLQRELSARCSHASVSLA